MASWEQHKDVLRTLYSSKNREIGTLRSIMAHMETKNSFVASKGQYERQFKKWGFRKNSTSEDWKAIHGKIQKRQNQGKKSAVYKSGKHVQVEKLNKEKRHNFRKVEELFTSDQSTQPACCVERHCQHAMAEPPGTPAGFTVCTPMGETTPPLLVNNLPSLQLFGRLKSFASAHKDASQNLFQESADNLTGNDQAASTCESDMDLTLLEECRLDGKSLQDLFQVSRAGELSPFVLPMLHRASNNLLSEHEASDVVDLIRLGGGRQVFNALISTPSPATQAIARGLLPAAIGFMDLDLVRSLLDTKVSPDAPMDYALRTPLQFAIAEGSLGEGVLDLIQLLLDYGARVNLPWAKGTSSPLVYAAAKGHFGLVQILLAAGADVNAHASTGNTTALQAATGALVYGLRPQVVPGNDRFKIAQLLLSAGADVNASPDDVWVGETALQAAVKRGNIALVQMLLLHGANVNAPAIKANQTALQGAASTGNLEVIDLLLMWGASDILAAIESALEHDRRQAAQNLSSFGIGLDDTDNEAYKRMALKARIRSGDYQLVQGLLELNVDLEARTGTNNARRTTALQEAAIEGDIGLVRLLISFGADVNAAAIGDWGETALQIAARLGTIELVMLLLDAGADVNLCSSRHGKMALGAAASAHRLEIVQLLLDSGADTYVQGSAATMAAIMADDGSGRSANVVRLLLNYIANSGVHSPDTRFEYYATYRYQIDYELMALLLKNGVIDEGDAILYALEQGDLGLVELALDWDAPMNTKVLENAVLLDDPGFMQLLLEHEPGPEDLARVLQFAAYKGHLEVAQLLIHAGADVNAAPLGYENEAIYEECRTSLQAAAQEGHLDVVRLLLEEGAEVERSSIYEDEEGTSLQFAAISGSIAIANELIQKGANVNAAPMGGNGRTALEGAAEHGRLDMVQLLLNLEAEIRGSRALQFARSEGHDGVALLLLQNGFEDDVHMSG